MMVQFYKTDGCSGRGRRGVHRYLWYPCLLSLLSVRPVREVQVVQEDLVKQSHLLTLTYIHAM